MVGTAAVQVLAEDIVPALEKLRKEKGQYMEWQAANANLDRQRRFCVALTWGEKCQCVPPGTGDSFLLSCRLENGRYCKY